MTLLDAKSQQWKAILERVATARDSRPYSYWNKLRRNAMNSPMAGADHGQTENQLAQQIRNAGSCRERAELLETKLEALLDRLRGSQPKTVPETINKDVSDHGMMTQLVSQHERTSTAIEGALVLLSEIEQYV